MSDLKPPSDMFERALTFAGSVAQTCDFCGRTHFGNGRDMEAGEHEAFLARAEKEPDRFIGHDYDSVEWGNLDGRPFVMGCPCNSARRYEDLFWSHRHVIAVYLSERAARQLARAEDDAEAAAKVKAATT